MNDKKRLDETIINGGRVFIENGEVKTVLSEEIQRNGYIPLETAKQLSIARIKKSYRNGKIWKVISLYNQMY